MATPRPADAPAPSVVATPVKKDQDDLNIEHYERVFSKCMCAAGRMLRQEVSGGIDLKVTIATAIFDRYFNDQSTLKAGQNQAKSMMEGLTQLLEGRR